MWTVSGHGGLSAPGDPSISEARSKVESMLVMSGGEGYIDFRIGEHWSLEFSGHVHYHQSRERTLVVNVLV